MFCCLFCFLLLLACSYSLKLVAYSFSISCTTIIHRCVAVRSSFVALLIFSCLCFLSTNVVLVQVCDATMFNIYSPACFTIIPTCLSCLLLICLLILIYLQFFQPLLTL